jgi:YfiH family protein
VEVKSHTGGLETWRFGFDSPQVLAATTTRVGGVSTGPFGGLNLGFHVGDDPACVTENRRLICGALDLTKLTVPDQQHGRDVAVIDPSNWGAGHDSLRDARARLGSIDALVTTTPGAALVIMVADCAPVVLFDERTRTLGVAHVGRNGAVVDVIGATVETMSGLSGCRSEDLRVGVGPCIGAEHYEIGGAALEQTRAAFGDGLLTPTYEDHARFDLLGSVLERLGQAGVSHDHVELCSADTFTNPDLLFSDRRERPCGRIMLIAALL